MDVDTEVLRCLIFIHRLSMKQFAVYSLSLHRELVVKTTVEAHVFLLHIKGQGTNTSHKVEKFPSRCMLLFL